MKQVKISIFLKILFFIINFIFLFNFIVIQNLFSIENLLMFVLLFINFVLQFLVLRNNKKAVLTMIFFPILLIIFFFLLAFIDIFVFIDLVVYIEYFFGIVSDGYRYRGDDSMTWFFIFLLFITFFLILFLILTYRKLKKENLAEKDFTEKKQEKTFCIIFGITFLVLFIFKFGYYNIPKKVEISDDLFITKLQNEKFESDENMYLALKKFLEKYKIEEKDKEFRKAIFYCLFKDKCLGEKQYYIDYLKYLENKENIKKPYFNLENFKKEIETMSTLDKINTKKILKENFEKYFYNKDLEEAFDEYLKISEKKYFKTNMEQNINIIGINRELRYKVFYLLQKGKEDDAIKILEKRLEIAFKILNGDSGDIEFITANLILDFGLDDIKIILEKYKISEKNKNILKNVLVKNNFDVKEIIDNSIKLHYKDSKNVIEKLHDGTYMDFYPLNKQSLFVLDDSINFLKEIAKTDLDRNFDFDYRMNNFKINVFKRNIVGYNSLQLTIFPGIQEKKLLPTAEKLKQLIEELKK